MPNRKLARGEMKLQQPKSLSDIYKREEDFSADLADTLDALGIGKFEGPETESKVGTRKADIVAVGEDGGKLVVENQFGQADWDHWGRLEAYARLKEATVAVLVAEDFEDLMIATCNLRNKESKINWYLIQSQANTHKELSFHWAARPAPDIQTEKLIDPEYKEFWEPILQSKLFADKSASVYSDDWVGKPIRDNIEIWLRLAKRKCYIELYFYEADRAKSRNEVMELFSKSDYNYESIDTSTETRVKFPIFDKGIKDRDSWDEIREKLVSMGTDIYNKINESGR